MTVRLLKTILAKDIKPGNKIEVFNEWYWVRYINYHASGITLRLQPEDEPLSPFYESDRATLTVPGDLLIEIEVEKL